MQPTLTDGVVTLGPFEPEDLAAHLAGEDDEQRRRFGFERPSTEETVRAAMLRWRESWRTGGPVRAFATRDAASGALVGGCELRLQGDGLAEVSYWTFPPFRGRGFASRSLGLLCGYAFTELGQARVELYAESGNAASLAVAHKAGFTEEGVLRSRATIAGRRRDMVVFSRLASDPGSLERKHPLRNSVFVSSTLLSVES